MARELGLNPMKLGKIDNHQQEPRKAPLPQFIEHLYTRRFGRPASEIVTSIEEHARRTGNSKKTGRKAARTAKRQPPIDVCIPARAADTTR